MNKKYAGLDFPAWFDGKDVNEAAFCREFLSKNKLIYADNAFFTPDGRLTDPLLLLKEKIYAELECCAAKNILRTISNIVEIMKLVVHAESFPPNPDEIHVQNGTLRIDGSFLAGRSEIVRSRFPIDYNPQAGKSVVWLRFLSDLLYPEDIPTFQEYRLSLVDEAYQILLSSNAREILDAAGCADAKITWGSKSVEPVEAIVRAAGLR